jgi:uncharacterized repeat protein (TIGR01451 family)
MAAFRALRSAAVASVLMLLVLLGAWPALTAQLASAAGTADLAVSMAGDHKRLRFGATMTFAITVENRGLEAATGVLLGFGTSDSYQNFGMACPDGSVSTHCDLGTLTPGDSVTAYATVRAASYSCCADPRLGLAVASVGHDADTVDPVSTNDEARVETKLVGKGPA